MNVLLVGGGGREHALAWKLAQSPRLTRLYVAPGNAGTESPQGRDAAPPRLYKSDGTAIDTAAASAGRDAAVPRLCQSDGTAADGADDRVGIDAAPPRLYKSDDKAIDTAAASAGRDAAVPRLNVNGLVQNVPIIATDTAALVAFAQANAIDLVVVGPEGPLAAGLADALRAGGLAVFGPSAAAAEIEASKAFSKAFMVRHGLPSARYGVFDRLDPALAYLHSVDYPVVIKASGLAAGKGVLLPETTAEAEDVLRRILVEREFGAAGDEVIIEERLAGPEVSLLAFCDGVTVRPMPPAQDHKTLLDGDHGPNTGGMGAYAPAPICPPALVDELTRTILQPAIDGLRAEGRPFIGVLYAGLMLTEAGPRVLEFNCRFGDPETQAILPLLDSDLLDILAASARGALASVDIRWKAGAAACVVLASEGYPGHSPLGRPIRGLEATLDQAVVFHAGTRAADGQVLTAGGRVLAVTGWGADLPQALARAYAAVAGIQFEGAQFRRDIGHRARERFPLGLKVD